MWKITKINLMKTSTKFWVSISLPIFIYLQFNKHVLDFESYMFLILGCCYIIICAFHLFFYIFKVEPISEREIKSNIFYWVLYLPITKFNNWLNSL